MKDFLNDDLTIIAKDSLYRNKENVSYLQLILFIKVNFSQEYNLEIIRTPFSGIDL